jgi:hypothetical protein
VPRKLHAQRLITRARAQAEAAAALEAKLALTEAERKRAHDAASAELQQVLQEEQSVQRQVRELGVSILEAVHVD